MHLQDHHKTLRVRHSRTNSRTTRNCFIHKVGRLRRLKALLEPHRHHY